MNALPTEKAVSDVDGEECRSRKETRKGKGMVAYGFVCLLVLAFVGLNAVLIVDVRTLQQKRSELVSKRYNSEMSWNTLKNDVLKYKKDIQSKDEDYQSDLNAKNEMQININKLHKEKEHEVVVVQELKRERDVLEKTIFGYEIELKYLQDELKQIAQLQNN